MLALRGLKGFLLPLSLSYLRRKKKRNRTTDMGMSTEESKCLMAKKKECLTHMQNDYYVFVIRYKGKHT